MKKNLDDATKIANFIIHQFTVRLFTNLCVNMDKQHVNLCYIEKSGGLAEEESSAGCLS
jgi:hypothetical protein